MSGELLMERTIERLELDLDECPTLIARSYMAQGMLAVVLTEFTSGIELPIAIATVRDLLTELEAKAS